MPDPTKAGGEGRPVHPGAEDDSSTIQIPGDQVHPDLAKSPHPAQDQTYQVQVNGRQETWTLDKLIAEAQQGAAGREKFQEAAQIRKEASKALGVEEDLKSVFEDGDIDAFRRLGAHYGVPGDEVERIAKKTFGLEGDEDDEDVDVVERYYKEVTDNEQTRSRPDGPVDYSRLSPDVQRVLREAEQVRIDKIVQNALDNDEVIAYNMEAHDPAGREAIRAYVNEKIRGRLDEFGGDFGDGTRILANILPEVRDHLQALGTPGNRTHTGLGQAPGGGDTEVHPKQLPDHVPSSEGDAYEQNILETMAYHHNKAQRGQQ
jgi:hypothetical protein